MTTHNVTIQNFAFSPPQIRIQRGDTVSWVSQDTVEHTVTADNGEFDSGDIVKGDPPFQHKFDDTGDVPYHCNHHDGMKGTVTVT